MYQKARLLLGCQNIAKALKMFDLLDVLKRKKGLEKKNFLFPLDDKF